MIFCVSAIFHPPPEPDDKATFSDNLVPFMNFFQCVTASLNTEERAQFITCLLEKFFSIISDQGRFNVHLHCKLMKNKLKK